MKNAPGIPIIMRTFAQNGQGLAALVMREEKGREEMREQVFFPELFLLFPFDLKLIKCCWRIRKNKEDI